jgi:dihydropteroate synthase
MSLSLRLARGTVSTEMPAFVMGILNATDDSFWEGSRAPSLESALALALSLAERGADIIDIGGESTRPGAVYVGEAEEIARVAPLVREIRKRSSVPLSVDTRKASVMRAALDEGADICNDVSALEDDPSLAPLVAASGIPVVLMHKRGVPASMQDAPEYYDVVAEVASYLFSRAEYALGAGIARDRIILDPGIGFGKRVEDNCALIANLAKIAAGGYPVLMGNSRKSFIGSITGRKAEDRLAGTLAAALVSVQNGASFLRVHDVAETKDTLAVLREIQNRGST